MSYPDAVIPSQPALSAATFKRHQRSNIPSVLDAGEALFVNRGSMAIALALFHSEISEQHEVLLPAYHCVSMIEPVVSHGARPVFYRIRSNTSIDLDHVEERLTGRTRALLVTHYFGFPQDMKLVRAFCDAHRLILIEDCAHAFFGSVEGRPLASFGDYAIASAWKFFPIQDGGLLVSRKSDLGSLPLSHRPIRFQIKSVVNTLEYAFKYRRMAPLHAIFKYPLRLRKLAQNPREDHVAGSALATQVPPFRFGGGGFDAELVNARMSIFSRLITISGSHNRIISARRSNFSMLLSAFEAAKGCKPLFSTLPDTVVPHVFPLVFEAPERAFAILKSRGVPIIRFGEYLWEGMDSTLCPVSSHLSRSVFQIPCHQDLRSEEMEWMIREIQDVAAY